jgi:cytochrome c553
MKIAPIHLVLALFVTSTGVMLVKGRQAVPAHQASSHMELVARGKYLVQLGGCTDCHTRKAMTERGPVDDKAMMFAGHPEGLILPPPEQQAGPWGAATAGMTAWTGPWGVSYAANLTPDRDTGMGSWTEAMFLQAMRTGKHMGDGRPILPPMPWQPLAEAHEDDLKAIYAYLRSLPPIKNRVPEPQPPVAATAQGAN